MSAHRRGKRGPYRKAKTIQQRFSEKVSPEPTRRCWLWTGAVNNKGYGVLNRGKYPLRGAIIYAHRFSLECALGRELAAGECALHKCDNPACVNPQHLWAGSKAENTRDMVAKGRGRGWPRGLPTWADTRRLTLEEALAHAG